MFHTTSGGLFISARPRISQARFAHGSGPNSCCLLAHLCRTHVAALLSFLLHFADTMPNDEQKKASRKKRAAKAKTSAKRAKALLAVGSPQGANQASLTGEGNAAVVLDNEVETMATPQKISQTSPAPKTPSVKEVVENWENFSISLDGRAISLQVPLHYRGTARRDAFLERNAAVPLFTAVTIRDLVRQYALAYEEDSLSAYLLRTADATALLAAPRNPVPSGTASDDGLSGRAQREQTVTLALQGIKPLELSGKNNDPRDIRSWLDDLKRALDRFEGMFAKAEWPKAKCGYAVLRLRGSLASVMSEWVTSTEGHTWAMFCDKVLKEFSPLDYQVQVIVSGLLAPCPHSHGGVIATQITQCKTEMLRILGPKVIASLEDENPAFLCALVRNGLAASYPSALAKIAKSDHLVKYLATKVANASEAESKPASAAMQPWHKDLQILQRTVENNTDASGKTVAGICVVDACTNCGGNHSRNRNGKANCKVTSTDGNRARTTIKEQANRRWRDLDVRSKSLTQPQQQAYQKRRRQFVDKLAAITDRSVEDSDWDRPDESMANSLASFVAQKPKGNNNKGGGGKRIFTPKRKMDTNMTAAITAAVVAGLKKKKKKKSSKEDE